MLDLGDVGLQLSLVLQLVAVADPRAHPKPESSTFILKHLIFFFFFIAILSLSICLLVDTIFPRICKLGGLLGG